MAQRTRVVDYETPRIDRFGRISIPKRYRDMLRLQPGDSVALVYDQAFDGLVLTALDISARRRA